MLSIVNLQRPGLQPVSLDIVAGTCATIRGKSGSGKSLLLRAIADLDPNSGEVRLDQLRRDSMPAPDWRRLVCYAAAESGWWLGLVGQHFVDPAGA
ncbi:MAG: ATP-binding cassette domain-containing protein, partial [Proteobacteria bacterium]|nr:ATP-binding cassette domain-containing protein [Pseudomonadota bacterium]